MTLIVYIANGLVMPAAMFFMANYYKFRGREVNFRQLPVNLFIMVITAIPSSLQFAFPGIINLLERDKEALLSGEIWRLLTPLFVQPMGIWQCVINGVFLISFLPLAEHFYRRRVLIIYFGAGLAGQIVNYYWSKGGGGSSTAIYGVIGSLFMYVVFHRNEFPRAYIFLPVAGFLGAIILCFFQDGHAPALLVGAILSLSFQRSKDLVKTAKA